MMFFSGKSQKKKGSIPKNVQQSLPFIGAYDNGMLQLAPGGRFAMVLKLDDAAFETLTYEDKDDICRRYGEFLNGLDTEGTHYAFYFVNSPCAKEEILSKIAPRPANDGLNGYRDELTQLYSDRLSESRNNFRTEKYFAVSVEADSVDLAADKLRQQESNLVAGITHIAGSSVHRMSLEAVLELMSRIYNGDDVNTEYFSHDIDGNTQIDWELMKREGKKARDIVAPSLIRTTGNDLQIGEQFAQSLYVDGLANYLKPKFLSTMCEVNFPSVVAVHVTPIATETALKMLKNAYVAKSTELVEKEQSSQGTDLKYVAVDTRAETDQIQAMQEAIKDDDQRCFYFTMTLLHFASDMQTLKKQTKELKKKAQEQNCSAKVIVWAQERGFNTCMPIAYHPLPNQIARLMPTSAMEVFQPFKEATVMDRGGNYYGTNPINGSIISVNRKNSNGNYNGALLGASGAGKTFMANKEIAVSFLSSSDDIIAMDPDGDYTETCRAFNGQVVDIAPGSPNHINPFDLDVDNSFDGDSPMAVKTDFIISLVETMMQAKDGLTFEQVALLTRCIQTIYRNYAEHLMNLPPDENGRRRTIDRDAAPTFANLSDELFKQPEPEAQRLALAIEPYLTGPNSMFSQRTNVDINNRFVCFNLMRVGNGLSELANKIISDFIFTRMLENRRHNKYTRAYFDEFHLFLKSPTSAKYFEDMFKRVRKRWGMPTIITQNVDDLLANPSGEKILRNTSFYILLKMESGDREDIAEVLPGLSDSDLSYLGSCDRGCGLIYTGGRAIRFVDHFPTNTRLYRILSHTLGSSAQQ